MLTFALKAFFPDTCYLVSVPGVCSVGTRYCGEIHFVILGSVLYRPFSTGNLVSCNWVLDLSYNGLTNLTVRVFEGLSSLQRLYLYNNQLTTLPAGVFEGLSSLQGLELGNNQLTTLPAGVFEGLSSLKHLFLHNNNFTALNGSFLASSVSLRELSLDLKVEACLSDEFPRAALRWLRVCNMWYWEYSAVCSSGSERFMNASNCTGGAYADSLMSFYICLLLL